MKPAMFDRSRSHSHNHGGNWSDEKSMSGPAATGRPLVSAHVSMASCGCQL